MAPFRFLAARKAPATLKREFAVASFAVWIAVSLRVFLSGDEAWIAAQGVNYATVTTSVFLFIAASVGLQTWQNTEAAKPPTEPPAAGVPG